MSAPLVLLLAFTTAAVGALGGLGGAIILVPILVLSGMRASDAAPLGLLSVAAGSLAAGPMQLSERTVHHRLGVTTETAGSAGAVIGALLSGAVGEAFLTRFLAVVAITAAAASGLRRDVAAPLIERPPDIDLGEQRGTLAGIYPVGEATATAYSATHLPAGLAAMTTAGVVAGVAGASGGFIKTPATTEIMGVPIKVAASTTTFTIGITSAAALIVFAIQGRIELDHAAPVIVGALAGGQVGARLQARFSARVVRAALGVVLVAVAGILVARS
ncbi:MAG TPA: sulfite exporter TauE/SafE family protein [Acidimicrobiia bacterium]|nr:sulfite exporter TauE/SafE family protein [Acidimicrobiia bacterium]